MQGCPWRRAQCHLQIHQYNHMISVGADSTSGHLAPVCAITLGFYHTTQETKAETADRRGSQSCRPAPSGAADTLYRLPGVTETRPHQLDRLDTLATSS